MPNYTLTISDTDKIALDTVINPHNMGIGTWAQNALSERARLAKLKIVSLGIRDLDRLKVLMIISESKKHMIKKHSKKMIPIYGCILQGGME